MRPRRDLCAAFELKTIFKKNLSCKIEFRLMGLPILQSDNRCVALVHLFSHAFHRSDFRPRTAMPLTASLAFVGGVRMMHNA